MQSFEDYGRFSHVTHSVLLKRKQKGQKRLGFARFPIPSLTRFSVARSTRRAAATHSAARGRSGAPCSGLHGRRTERRLVSSVPVAALVCAQTRDGQIVRIEHVCIDRRRRVYSNDAHYRFMTPDLHSCSRQWCIYRCTRRLRALPDWHNNIVGSVTFFALSWKIGRV
jgi:hypothetical protein